MMIFMWTLFAINTRLTFFTLWAQVWVLMKCIDVVKVVTFKAAHSHVSGAMILCHAALGDHISPYPCGRVKSKYSSKVGQMKSAYSWAANNTILLLSPLYTCFARPVSHLSHPPSLQRVEAPACILRAKSPILASIPDHEQIRSKSN